MSQDYAAMYSYIHLPHRNKKDYNSVRLYYNSMKSSISAKIPTELYEEVQAAIKEKKYVSNTECIIEGLILLLRNQDIGDSELNLLLQNKEKEVQNLQDKVNSSKIEIQVLRDEVNRSKDEVKHSNEGYTGQIKSLEEKLKVAPDIAEFSRLQAKVEDLHDHNETLQKELEKAERDKEDLKTMYNKLQDTYNNYMAQMQTLINQKSIEVPGAKKPWWRFW